MYYRVFTLITPANGIYGKCFKQLWSSATTQKNGGKTCEAVRAGNFINKKD
jgi:hypothetical protein